MSPLGSLPSKTLQQLASRCGLTQTGTKSALLEHIQIAASQSSPVPPYARILSIDLGLRNFAFSLLTLPPSSPLLPSVAPPLEKVNKVRRDSKPPLVTLQAWRHINLLSPLPPPSTSVSSTSPTLSNIPEFNPPTLAHLTLSLIQTHLLPLRPTHILIERQRFRSGGQAAVQEWTLRVNTLEAMLHACFETIKSLDPSSWNGELIPVPPARVVKYLVGNEGVGEMLLLGEAGGQQTGEEGSGKVTGREMKLRKVRLLERMLKEGGRVEVGGEEVKGMVGAFLDAGERKGKGKKEKGKKEMEAREAREVEVGDWTKRDDLADCVLQGIVWLEWQRNLDEVKRMLGLAVPRWAPDEDEWPVEGSGRTLQKLGQDTGCSI